MKYKFRNMGGINWSWLLCYEEVEGGVRIAFYDRWHNFDDRMAPAWVERCMALGSEQAATALGGCEIKESNPGRIAVALQFAKYEEVGPDDRPYHLAIDKQKYRHVGHDEVPIVNPAYVFSYNNLDEVQRWIEGGEYADVQPLA